MNPEAVRKMRETSLLGILRGVGACHVCAANKILEDHRFVSQSIWAPLEKTMLVQFKKFAQQWSSAQKQPGMYRNFPMAGTLAAVRLQHYVVSFFVVFFPSGIFLDLHYNNMGYPHMETFYSQTHDGDPQGVVSAVFDFLYTIVPTKNEEFRRELLKKQREGIDRYRSLGFCV